MVDPNETPLAPTPESEIRKDDTPEQVADELLNKIEEKQEEVRGCELSGIVFFFF